MISDDEFELFGEMEGGEYVVIPTKESHIETFHRINSYNAECGYLSLEDLYKDEYEGLNVLDLREGCYVLVVATPIMIFNHNATHKHLAELIQLFSQHR